MQSFEMWLENIFGLSKKESGKAVVKADDLPIKNLSVPKMMDYLSEQTIGTKEGKVAFANEVRWGVGPGAIRVTVSTSYGVFMERLGKDLLGDDVWITKKVFQINDDVERMGYEYILSEDITQHAKIIDSKLLDYPKSKYDVRPLAINTANKLRQVARDMFMFNSLREITENTYVIQFDMMGAGVGAIGGSNYDRSLENLVFITFSEQTGVIKLINTDIESNVGQNMIWRMQPSDVNMSFFPTQNIDEISETMAVTFRWY